MKHLLTVILLLAISAIVVTSCHGTSADDEARLAVADSIMYIDSDSALQILQKFNSDKIKHFDKKSSALYALLMTQAMYRTDLPVYTDSLMSIAINYYKGSDDNLHKARTFFYAAQVYRDIDERELAVDYFNKAEAPAKEANDLNLLYLLYTHWGNLFQGEKPYTISLQKYMLAEKYARLSCDTSQIIKSLLQQSWCYSYMGHKADRDSKFNFAVELAKRSNDRKLRATLYNSQAFLKSRNGQATEALSCINKALEYKEFAYDSLLLFFTKGIILSKLGMLDSAKIYLEYSDYDSAYNSKASVQKELAEIERIKGNFKEAFKHSQSYAAYLDSTFEEAENKNNFRIQKKYDYSKFKDENSQLHIENQKRGILLLVGLVVFICIVFLVIIYLNYVKNRNIKMLSSKDIFIEKLRNQLQQKENEISNQSDEIIEKSKDVTGLILDNQEIIAKIEKWRSDVKNINDSDLLASPLNQSELEYLIQFLDFSSNGFTTRLKKAYPQLNNSDLYLCCLIRLEIKNRNIVFLLNVSEEALKRRKYRLKYEKLLLPKGSISLDEFIVNF